MQISPKPVNYMVNRGAATDEQSETNVLWDNCLVSESQYLINIPLSSWKVKIPFTHFQHGSCYSYYLTWWMQLQGEIFVHENNLCQKCLPKTDLTPNTNERSEVVFGVRSVEGKHFWWRLFEGIHISPSYACSELDEKFIPRFPMIAKY